MSMNANEPLRNQSEQSELLGGMGLDCSMMRGRELAHFPGALIRTYTYIHTHTHIRTYAHLPRHFLSLN